MDNELAALQAERDRRDQLKSLEAERDRRQAAKGDDSSSSLMSMDNAKTAMNIMNPTVAAANYIGKNVGAGAIEGNVNLAKTIRDKLIPNPVMSNFLTDIASQKLMGPLAQTKPVQNLSQNLNEMLSDPYKKMGTEEAPWYTPSGAAQTLGKYASGGELGAARGVVGKALELEPAALKTASFLRKQLPNMATGALAGAGTELNEAQPSLKGAVEKSLAGMLLPPAISKVGEKLTEYVPKTFDKLKDNIAKTWDYLTPGKKVDEIQDHLKGETKRIDQSVDKQVDYVKENAEKEKSAYEAAQNSKIRDVNHEYDQQINHIDNIGKEQIKTTEAQTKQQVEDLHDQVKTGTEQVNENLGQGMTNTEQTSRAIANDIRALHDPAQANASSYYDHVLGQADREYQLGKQKGYPGRGLLYQPADPLVSTAPQQGAEVMAAVKKQGFGEVGEKFRHEPTLRNAHNLKQEIGFRASDIRSLGKNKTAEQRLELGQLDNLYHQVDRDMMNYLDNVYPNKNENLSKIWKQGDQIYQDQVLPFLYNKKLREINRATKPGGGRKEYVKDMHKAFEHPGEMDIQMPDGSTQPGPARKLLQMLPDKTKNLILFNKLGAPVHEDINAIASNVNKAKTTEGMSQYVTPTLEQHISDILSKKQMAKELPIQTKSSLNEMKANIASKLDELKTNKTAHVESLKEDKSNAIQEMKDRQKAHEDELKEKARIQKETMKEEADKLIRPLEKRGNKIRAGTYLAAGGALGYLGKNIYTVLTGNR